MNINHSFLHYLKPYLNKLRDRIGSDFVVFGSAPLYLFNVVEFSGSVNDLDISVKDLTTIPKEAKTATFHKDPEQKFYKIKIDDLEVDIASAWPGYETFFNKIHDDPVVVDGFKFAGLDVVEEWKREVVREYNRAKDKDYLQKIKEYRDGNYIY